MSISAARVRVAAAILGGVAVLGLAACAQPVTGTGTPAAAPRTTAPTTVVAPSTVYVPPPATVTVQQPPKARKPLTPCQRMYADGYSYDAALSAWAVAGYPPNWDADNDGFPCEQSYGEQN